MSKYQQRGDYHFQLYKTKGDPYREHVLDVMVQVEKHVPACCQVLDVGCGEGLVTYLLLESELGLGVVGCEIDGDAVALAATRNLPVEQVSFEDIDELHYEAILFLDSLEHVDDYVAVLEKAKRMTDILLIAVPDRHDPHATVQVGRQRIVDQFDLSWQMVHDETRHARHFMIFTKREFKKIELPDEIAEAFLPKLDENPGW